MAVTDTEDVQIIPISPPSEKTFRIKDKFSLVLELIWLHILLLPACLLEILRKVLPRRGKSLKDQVALVTGAGRGLGRGLALRLAQEGCRVAVADVNTENALETVKLITEAGGTAKAYFTNVARVSEVAELRTAVTQDLGPVDILLHNAGLVYGEPILHTPVEAIDAVIAVNLTSHFYLVKEFLPSMKERNKGHLVAIASVASFVGIANASAYVASKFGVRGFMEVVSAELKQVPHNRIKTTTVFPYFINTSAQYVDHWELRIPPISIEEAVEATIKGVKRDEVSITIPGFFYTMLHLTKLLPEFIVDKLWVIFHVRIRDLTEEVKATSPTAAIIRDLVGSGQDGHSNSI